MCSAKNRPWQISDPKLQKKSPKSLWKEDQMQICSAGILRDFSDPQNEGLKIQEMFGAFFVRQGVTRVIFLCQLRSGDVPP